MERSKVASTSGAPHTRAERRVVRLVVTSSLLLVKRVGGEAVASNSANATRICSSAGVREGRRAQARPSPADFSGVVGTRVRCGPRSVRLAASATVASERRSPMHRRNVKPETPRGHATIAAGDRTVTVQPRRRAPARLPGVAAFPETGVHVSRLRLGS
jgi:hypothetical protein